MPEVSTSPTHCRGVSCHRQLGNKSFRRFYAFISQKERVMRMKNHVWISKGQAIAAMALTAILLLTGLAVSQQPAAPTFTKDVAPIFQEKCQACHRPGYIAPMSLLTYDD